MAYFPTQHVRLTTQVTTHPPARLGAPFAALGLLAGVIAGRFVPEWEWIVLLAVAPIAGAVGYRLHRMQRREIERGLHRVGTAPVFGSCYLLGLGLALVMFGVAIAATYEPGLSLFGPDDTVGSILVDLLQMLAALFLIPLVLAGLWILPVSFVVGSAAAAGSEPLGSDARPFLDRATWSSFAGVTAAFSLLAWPEPGAGLVAALLRPGPLAALASIALAALVALADLMARVRLAALPSTSSASLAIAATAVRSSLATLALTVASSGVHVFIAH